MESPTKNTNQILVVKGGTLAEGEDNNYYSWHKATNRFKLVEPVQLVDVHGFRFIVHKTFEGSRYYMASEIATGIPAAGSCVDQEAFVAKLTDFVGKAEQMLLDNFKLQNLTPRYKSKGSIGSAITKSIRG